MIKLALVIGLVVFIAALSVLGSPFFAILLVVPAALFYAVWAGAAVVAATPEEGSTEDSPANLGGDKPVPRGRPAGSAKSRAFRRERAARLHDDG